MWGPLPPSMLLFAAPLSVSWPFLVSLWLLSGRLHIYGIFWLHFVVLCSWVNCLLCLLEAAFWLNTLFVFCYGPRYTNTKITQVDKKRKYMQMYLTRIEREGEDASHVTDLVGCERHMARELLRRDY